MTVSDEDQERIRFLMEYIWTHQRENADMDRLAALAHMSKSKLKYTFRAMTGMTVAEYRTQERLRCVCDLLTESDLTVEEVGAAIGFSSISSFCRFFKEQLGQSPGNYRIRTRETEKNTC